MWISGTDMSRIQNPESRIRKKFLVCLCFILASGFWILDSNGALADQFADSTWASVQRYLAVHPGTTEPVWQDTAKSLVTNGLMQMTPVGDGTYRAVLQLTPGASYNFMYFAITGSNPPTGLQPNYTYFDAVPSGGNIQSGTQPLKVTQYDTTTQAPARYGAIGTNFDARRVLSVPSNLSPGDTFYIYGNFADRPISIKNFDAQPVDTTTVRLTWDAPYGSWGQGGENFKAVDVIAGGNFKIYRNTTGSTTTYTLLGQVSGTTTSYVDSGLTKDSTYYYILTATDAYQGLTTDSPFMRGTSDSGLQDSATPKGPVRVRFKVHHLDWDYVSKNNYVVYLTPATEEDVWFARRIQGVIRRVDL